MDLADIDLSVPFSLYAKCIVHYSGRASSTLALGNYLILSKLDGSFLVHGALYCKANNYQGPGSKLSVAGQCLTSRNKNETLTITISEMLSYSKLMDWSSDKIAISKTEKELVDKIQKNWATYFPNKINYQLYREFKTALGDIDILGISSDNTDYLVLEAKRRKASLKDCTQLLRYIESFRDNGITGVDGWLAAPAIGAKALKYLQKHNLHWLTVDFD